VELERQIVPLELLVEILCLALLLLTVVVAVEPMFNHQVLWLATVVLVVVDLETAQVQIQLGELETLQALHHHKEVTVELAV
jgi:hypothetical protein